MAATSYKVQVLAAQMAEDLARRFTTVSGITLDSDSNPYFTVTLGTLVSDQECALIKLYSEQPLGTDGLGQTPRSFGPSSAIIVLEQLAGNSGTTVMTAKNVMNLVAEVAKFGVKIDLVLNAHTDAIDVSDTGDAPTATWEASYKWRGMSNS